MAGWFVLSSNDKKQFWFILKAGNAETVLKSEMYTTKAAAKNGIESVRKNCVNDERYERKTAKNGQFFFNLKAGNGQVVGTSEMYVSAQGCDKGIASVKANGTTSTIKEKEKEITK